MSGRTSRRLPRRLAAREGERPALLSTRELATVIAAYRASLPAGRHLEAHLRGVIQTTLSHPGNLMRAQLVFASGRRRGLGERKALRLAVALEYFHGASLLFDDLPAMDDARERRGHPCAHLVHGEAAAMLGGLALINQGYALLWQGIDGLGGRGRRVARLVNQCLGLAGLLDGQARDLHFGGTARGEADVLAVAAGKTVPLIRLALLLPAVAAGASRLELARLDQLAEAWGLAYQICDDFKDLLVPSAESGKSAGRDHLLGRPNLPAAIGPAAAMARLDVHLAAGRSLIGELPGAPELAILQTRLEDEKRALKARLDPGANL